MTAARARTIAHAIAVAVLVGVAPLALAVAQAATITMPKHSAQRAAAAASARVQAQVNQAEAAPTPSRSQGVGARQGAGATPNVVQSGTPSGATPAPDPGKAIMREVFDYSIQGRRDPFFSLLATGDLRPMLSDLRLTTILYDPTGRRPVAVMNDVSTSLQYRVTTGMMLGRMRVTQIQRRKVIFAIEEFGFSRADSLVLADKPQTRQ
jgi:hypothetical protein